MFGEDQNGAGLIEAPFSARERAGGWYGQERGGHCVLARGCKEIVFMYTRTKTSGQRPPELISDSSIMNILHEIYTTLLLSARNLNSGLNSKIQ